MHDAIVDMIGNVIQDRTLVTGVNVSYVQVDLSKTNRTMVSGSVHAIVSSINYLDGRKSFFCIRSSFTFEVVSKTL
jgi:hypothetical protein